MTEVEWLVFSEKLFFARRCHLASEGHLVEIERLITEWIS